MPGIGETLREARVRQRVNIEELEQSTKIRAKYLRALENEEFGLLPGPTYVKSFLRTYAEKLGLDAQLLVEEFRRAVRGAGAASRSSRSRRRRATPAGARPRRRFGPGAAVVVAGIALLAFLLVLGLTGDEDEPDQTSDSGPAKTQPAPSKPAAPATPERVVLRVIPAFPTYVCIDRGPETLVFEGTIDCARDLPRARHAADQPRQALGRSCA